MKYWLEVRANKTFYFFSRSRYEEVFTEGWKKLLPSEKNDINLVAKPANKRLLVSIYP